MPTGQGPRRRKAEVLARDPLGRKRCITCEQWLEVSCYVGAPHTSDGLSGKCRSCSSRTANARSHELRGDLLSLKGNRCWCCGREGGKRSLHVDHDHACCPSVRESCGECARGLLCSNCNTGIGLLGDDLEGLLRAVEYLREATR